MESDLLRWVALPIGLGLLGFIEPCSIGATLLFIQSLEGHDRLRKLAQVTVFAGVRALFMGTLGLAAATVGSLFLEFQRAAWIAFGAIYVALGMLYLSGKSGVVARSFGPALSRLATVRGAAVLGALFALNIPACAGPLLLTLLGVAAMGGSGGVTPGAGFLMLALFGLALSLPLVLAAMFARMRALFDSMAVWSRRVPLVTGAILVVLGVWSAWAGVSAVFHGAS